MDVREAHCYPAALTMGISFLDELGKIVRGTWLTSCPWATGRTWRWVGARGAILRDPEQPANKGTHSLHTAVIQLLSVALLACCKSNGATPNLGELQARLDARGSTGESNIALGKNDSAGVNAADEGEDGGSSAASSSPTKANNADVAHLKSCCRKFERLGEGSKNQEGVGFVGRSSVCDDIVSAVEHGEPPPLNDSDWETIRPMLDEKSVPSSCRTMMLRFGALSPPSAVRAWDSR